jgi:iron complex transport system substrate-binding protein
VDVPARRLSARRSGAVASFIAAIALIVAACAAPAPSASPSRAPSSPPSPSTNATPAPSPSPAPFPVTLRDDEGTDVALTAEPARIVSLTPATTEILFALGVGDRVVATTDFDDYPPEAVALPDVASYTGVDVEKIVGLEADLVIAGGNNFNDPQAVQRLRSLGIPVLVVYAPTVDAVLADIELIGRAIGRPAQGAELVAAMKARFEAIAKATAGLPKPRVFYELDATNGYFGPAPDYFGVEMIRLAGGDPLTSGTPGVFQIPAERIVAFDPEVILLGDAAYGVTPDQVAQRAGWGAMSAVRSGAIRPVDDILITRPGPRLVDGLRALALAIHPDVALP